MLQPISLVISGPPKSGKTATAQLIASALRHAGADVKVLDQDPGGRPATIPQAPILIQVLTTGVNDPPVAAGTLCRCEEGVSFCPIKVEAPS